MVFGCHGIYYCNGDETNYPGSGLVPYVQLATRTIVNHGVDVYLGQDQYVCPEPENTDIDCENLAALLTQLQGAWMDYRQPLSGS